MLIRSPVVGGSRRSRNCSSEVVACSVSLIDIKDFAEMNEAFGGFMISMKDMKAAAFPPNYFSDWQGLQSILA